LQATEKSITLAYEIDASVPTRLIGDEARLRQLLANLVSNALKFTKKGRIDVNVYSSDLEKDRVRLTFRIRDTGVGIPEDKLEEIFDYFTQGDASDTRIYGGIGLGLAISRRLAGIMKGDIMVSSIEGKGSVFEVEVVMKKLTRRGEVGFNLVNSDTSLPEAPVPEEAKLSILVAEDDPYSQRYVHHILSKTSHTFNIASNGLEAIEYINSMHYDVILMDIQMPGKDGLEVTRYVRERLEPDRQPYIVAVTARAMKGERERFLGAGMDNYLSKPYTVSELMQVLMP
jgi:CheY-like chemotaxis protein